MDTAQVKEEVWALADELNVVFGASRILPEQQEKTPKNISITGHKSGRLYIKPAGDGYQIALSGNDLVDRMASFMDKLTCHERDGYNQPGKNGKPHREPRWSVGEYAHVRAAAYFYAGATLPSVDDETIDTDLKAIDRRSDLNPTQRDALIQARLGQGTYRKQMLNLWDGKCAVTGLTIQAALIASHAQPWSGSTDKERLDPCNGLPLMATLDKLFDKHLIAFAPTTGEMLISHKIDEANRLILGIPANLRIAPNKQQAHYLKLHLDQFELQSKSKINLTSFSN